MIVHPSYNPQKFTHDLGLLQLAAPITTIKPLAINTGALPAAGTFCTEVGFGGHNEPDGSFTSGIKRSASEKVRTASSTDLEYGAFRVSGTGLGYYGDSGAPVICNGTVAAVESHGNPNDPPPGTLEPVGDSTHGAPVEPSWINSAKKSLAAVDLWRVAEPSPVSSENYPYFAVTTGFQGVPYIAYAKVPLDGGKVQWLQASTTSDPPGTLASISGPAMVYLTHADGSPGDLQVFATGATGVVLEKHQTNGVWRTWGHFSPSLPLVGSTQPKIASAPAAVAPRHPAEFVYKDAVVAITDNRGAIWANATSLNADGSVHWGAWTELPLLSTSSTSPLRFTTAPSLWADSFGTVRAVAVAGSRAFESRLDPTSHTWQVWQELPGGGVFGSGVVASYWTDFQSPSAVDYAGAGTNMAPFVNNVDLNGGTQTGWIGHPLLAVSTAVANSAAAVGNDLDFDNGFRRFMVVRSIENGQTEYYWRLVTDAISLPWRKMVRF
jgi:hypothetical protein